jgi:hypothetical protein
MKKATNPIAITPQAVAGRRLEAGWQQSLGSTGGTYDRRRLEDLWKDPQWSSKASQSTSENLAQNARLSPSWEALLGRK